MNGITPSAQRVAAIAQTERCRALMALGHAAPAVTRKNKRGVFFTKFICRNCGRHFPLTGRLPGPCKGA